MSIQGITEALTKGEGHTQNVIELSDVGKEKLEQTGAGVGTLISSLGELRTEVKEFFKEHEGVRAVRSSLQEAAEQAVSAESAVGVAFINSEALEPARVIGGALQVVTEQTADTRDRFNSILNESIGALAPQFLAIQKTLENLQKQLDSLRGEVTDQSEAADQAKTRIVNYRDRINGPGED